ncbi:DUF2188 domain-containing protein [Reyranella sp.]|uniref:DUF2188 domain-containing protein n=1 Tax=Reyranella sp. TaxID=1929291 RepID=UPI00351EEE53
MNNKTLYVSSHGRDGGVVKRSGSANPTSTHSTQSAAWIEARRLARGAGGEVRLLPLLFPLLNQ